MKNYHLTTLFLTLFVCTANHAQITFDFTAGSFDGTTWTQTVEGVTCTATFDDDSTFLDVATLSGQDGKTFIDSSEGMYMGEYVGPTSATHRTGFARPGARITFSQDIRLKSYTLGRSPGNRYTVCVLVGGNVTGIASHGGDDHTGERSFALESLVPANTTLAASVGALKSNNSHWRFKTLTVELEPYVEPVIPIPEGSETGITRISTLGLGTSDYKYSFVLKNGRLHHWSEFAYGDYPASRDFIFDGGESGVLDFWTKTGTADHPVVLLETVEGFVLFSFSSTSYYHIRMEITDIPASPDQISIAKSDSGTYVMALKDGVISFDGASAEAFRSGMPAELSSGGVSEIAASDYTALAVKDGQLYTWGVDPGPDFSVQGRIPLEVTNGEVLHLAAHGPGAEWCN